MAEEVMRRYRGRVLYGPLAPLDPVDMQTLEAEIGYPIPPAYRAFLEVAHGGSLDYSVRVPRGASGETIACSDLDRAGRDDRGEYGFGTLLGEYRHWSQIAGAGRVLLPVARDGELVAELRSHVVLDIPVLKTADLRVRKVPDHVLGPDICTLVALNMIRRVQGAPDIGITLPKLRRAEDRRPRTGSCVPGRLRASAHYLFCPSSISNTASAIDRKAPG